MRTTGTENSAKQDIILTGLPRGSTTLTCHLLNQVTDVVALHQPLALDDAEAATVLEAGMKVLRAHHLDAERRRFFAVLDDFREFCNGR